MITVSEIKAACQAAGAPCKIYQEENQEMLIVALGHNWMYNATDSGTKYDDLIDKLNQMGAEPCAAYYSSTAKVLF